jgi:hypothetical protein
MRFRAQRCIATWGNHAGARATPGSERGMALFAALLTTTLVAAIAGALVLASSSEIAVAANVRAATTARLAADAAATAALAELRTMPDWTDLPGGTALASFADGAPTGTRTLDDGTTVDLNELLNLVNCGRRTSCSAANMAQTTPDRPWGPLNPQWRPFGAASLSDLVAAAVRDRRCLVVTFVADDPADNDGDRLHDGLEVGGQPNPGRGVLMLRADVFCTRRTHKILEVTVARSGTSGDIVAAGWAVARRELN